MVHISRFFTSTNSQIDKRDVLIEETIESYNHHHLIGAWYLPHLATITHYLQAYQWARDRLRPRRVRTPWKRGRKKATTLAPAAGDGAASAAVGVGLGTGPAVVVGGASAGAGDAVPAQRLVADVAGGGQDAAADLGLHLELVAGEALGDGAGAGGSGGDPAELVLAGAAGHGHGVEDRKSGEEEEEEKEEEGRVGRSGHDEPSLVFEGRSLL